MHKAYRIWLIAVSVLNGIAGLVTGVLFIISPDGSLMGFEPLVDVVRTLPLADFFFQDLMWIGIAMLLVLALPNLLALAALIRKHGRQYQLSLTAAVLLMLWCGFEIPFMFNYAAVGYFIVGAISAVISVRLLHSGKK